MPRVTLKMIAREARVSIATVSLALRGQGKLDRKTVERVRKTAQRLGYTPDPLLASLASRRFRAGKSNQGLPMALLEFPVHEGNSALPVSRYRPALTEWAKSLGYSPQVYSLEDLLGYEDPTRLLYHRGTVAVAITGQPDSRIFADPAKWSSFSLVQCGRYRSFLPIHTVRPNIFQAIQLSFEKAIEVGYSRIGFAIGKHPIVLEDDLARYGAAIAFSREKLSPKNRIDPFFGDIEDRDGMLDWTHKNRPDCIVSFSSSLYYDLKNEGVSFPEDMGFVCLHLPEHSENENFFSGLNQEREEIARQTIIMLDQMIRHNDRGIPALARNVLVPSHWTPGETIRKSAPVHSNRKGRTQKNSA